MYFIFIELVWFDLIQIKFFYFSWCDFDSFWVELIRFDSSQAKGFVWFDLIWIDLSPSESSPVGFILFYFLNMKI